MTVDNVPVPTRRYRGRLLLGPFQPVQAAEIQALEQETGRPLPPAYREFLDTVNGCRFFPWEVRVPPRPDGELISFNSLHLLGRGADGSHGWGTLLGEYRAQRDRLREQIPDRHLLPVAVDGGGSTLFVDLGSGSGNGTGDGLNAGGRVLAYVHGLPAWTGRSEQDMFGVLAEDFHAYVDSLLLGADVVAELRQDAADLPEDEPWRIAVSRWLDHEAPGWHTRR